MLHGPPTATFTIRGSRPVSMEVDGIFDAAASVGFRAVIASLVGDHHVTIDLTRCTLVDEVAEQTVRRALQRIEAAGGQTTLLPGPLALHAPGPLIGAPA